MYIYMYIYISMHVCMHACVYVCVCLYKHMCICVHRHTVIMKLYLLTFGLSLLFVARRGPSFVTS